MGPLTSGQHALLIAPTAGGKTEAAGFPILSRMLTEDWRGPSVLYLCPLRALLNTSSRGFSAMPICSAAAWGCGTET